jgi:membrane protein implicated in regulation of membrane protease activity
MVEAFAIAPPGFGWWLFAGLALCAAETLAPGAFLIWIGAACVIVGGVLMAIDLSGTAQLLLFAGLVVALVMVGRRVYGSLDKHAPPHHPGRAEALVGQEFYLEAEIARGFGSIRVNDSIWRVCGADAAAGAKVRVTGVADGGALKVESV